MQNLLLYVIWRVTFKWQQLEWGENAAVGANSIIQNGKYACRLYKSSVRLLDCDMDWSTSNFIYQNRTEENMQVSNLWSPCWSCMNAILIITISRIWCHYKSLLFGFSKHLERNTKRKLTQLTQLANINWHNLQISQLCQNKNFSWMVLNQDLFSIWIK